MTGTMRDHDGVARGTFTRRSAASLALLAPFLMAGCSFSLGEDEKASGGQDTEGGAEGSASDSGGAASDGASNDGTSAGSGGAVVDEDTAAAGVNPAALGKPVYSVEVPAVVEGDPKATMTVALYGLVQNGKTVTATYSFLVHSAVTPEEPHWLYSYLGDHGWTPFAVDTVNLNRHDVLQPSDGSTSPAMTEYQGEEFWPGQTLYAFAMFAAPPDDVTTMDVYLVDSAPMAHGVEITR